MSKFGEFLDLATLEATLSGINKDLRPVSEATMVAVLGPPKGTLTADEDNSLISDIAGLILETRTIGPLKDITGITPALDSLERIVKTIGTQKPDLLQAMSAAGMLSVRLRRPTSGIPSTEVSNHAWGTAIDIAIDGQVDTDRDGRVQRGIAELIPFFNDEGWFSGAGFRAEDDTHFEVGDDRINAWADRGLFGQPTDDAPGGEAPQDDQPATAGDAPAEDPRALLKAAMDQHGLRDNELRAGIAAIADVESGFKPRSEHGYGGTSAARIRQIFPSRVAGLSDDQIDALKQDDQAFFNRVYGNILGNDQSGDGFKYRGRGIFQLTGKSNYHRYTSKLADPAIDLVANPDLANDPRIAAEVAVVYMIDRYRPPPSGFERMKLAVGRSIPSIDARKNARFRQFLASGEFAAQGV